jgi:hypothetical protein
VPTLSIDKPGDLCPQQDGPFCRVTIPKLTNAMQHLRSICLIIGLLLNGGRLRSHSSKVSRPSTAHRHPPAGTSQHRAASSPPFQPAERDVRHFFFANLGAPISDPRSLMLSTLSMAPRTFWSGVAVPRSKSATTEAVVLHRVARSFCVILGSTFWRACAMASPTCLPTVLGLTMSSERSTLVRRWPSTPGLEA